MQIKTVRYQFTPTRMTRIKTDLYKKNFNDLDNHDGVITHLQPDILECEVKQALGSVTTKLVEVMEFQLRTTWEARKNKYFSFKIGNKVNMSAVTISISTLHRRL